MKKIRKNKNEEKSDEPDYLKDMSEVSVFLAKNNDTSLDLEFAKHRKLNSPKHYRKFVEGKETKSPLF
jgi:hypothetical protein